MEYMSILERSLCLEATGAGLERIEEGAARDPSTVPGGCPREDTAADQEDQVELIDKAIYRKVPYRAFPSPH